MADVTPTPSAATPAGNDTLRAAAWMVGAILSFSAMAVAGRAVSFELDTFEIMMYRSLIGFALVLLFASALGRLPEIRTRRFGLHVIRNICHFTGQNLWFFAITVIPLAQVFALEFTAPLWALFLAPLVLGERLTLQRVLAAFIGFAGILIVTRPSPDTLSWGLVAAAIAAIGFAGTAVTTRRLTRNDSLTCILFWLTGLQLIFGLICAGHDLDIALPSGPSLPWLLIIGLGGLVAHFCLTTALKLAPATVVMPVDFTRLPLIAVIGMVLYGEALDIYVFIGAAVIFAANYTNIWVESRARRT